MVTKKLWMTIQLLPSMDDDTVIKDGKNILPDESKIAKEIKLQRKKDNIFIFGHNEETYQDLK